jgi:hypothetical protein
MHVNLAHIFCRTKYRYQPLEEPKLLLPFPAFELLVAVHDVGSMELRFS